MTTSRLRDSVFDTGEVALAYSAGPPGAMPVVFLHGGVSSRHHWDFLLSAFVDRFTVYTVDQRGHGQSGRATSGYRFVDFTRDAIAFLQQVVVEPAVLIGHSLGGAVTVKTSADVPSLVRAAVLVDPPLYSSSSERFPGSVFEALFQRSYELRTSVEGAVASLQRSSRMAGRHPLPGPSRTTSLPSTLLSTKRYSAVGSKRATILTSCWQGSSARSCSCTTGAVPRRP